MKQLNRAGMVDELAALAQRIRDYRSQHGRRCRFRDDIVAAAVHLAEIHGCPATAAALGIHYSSIRRWITRASVGKVSPTKVEFIELSPPSQSLGCGRNVEISRPDGCRMLIRNIGSEGIAFLARSFLGDLG